MLLALVIVIVIILEILIIEAKSCINTMRDLISCFSYETVGVSYSELLKITEKNLYIYDRNFQYIQTRIENKDVLFYPKDIISFWRLKLNNKIKDNSINEKRKNNYLKTALK